MLRVFIADDDESVRFGLRTLLSLKAGIEIVDEADRTERLASRVRECHPDLVLLDWELPECVDHSLIDALHSAASHPKVIVLSTHADQEQPALAAGSEAFVCKADPPGRLLGLVKELAQVTAQAAVDGGR